MIICSPQLGMSPKSTLGGEVYDREVLTRLAKLGCQIEVLLPKNKPYDKLIKNLYVEYAPLRKIFPAYLYGLIIIPYLFKKYRQTKFDILRVHVHFLAFGVFFFKLFYPKLPVVAHYHLDEDGIMFNIVNKIFLNKCNLIIADSYFLKEKIIRKFGVFPNKIQVVHCGTDLNIKPGPKDPSIEKKLNLTGKFVFIYMGRLIERKRPIFLVEVFNVFHKIYPNSALLIFGKGPLEREIRKKIIQYRLENSIFLLGLVFGKEKIRYYNTSDAFIFPSINEGFVLVVLEALAAGLPIIATDAVSFKEAVINGKNGFLVKRDNIKNWVKVMETLTKNTQLAKRMGLNSRKEAETKFSWDKTAGEVDKSLKDLLFQK